MIKVWVLVLSFAGSEAMAVPPHNPLRHPPVMKTPPIPLSDFDRAMAAARSDEHQTDQFAASAVDPAIVGKPFSFALPAEQYPGAGRPKYTYENGVLTLDLETGYVRAPVARGKLGLNMMHSILVQESHKMTGRYVGQNAYGATTEVTSFSGKSNALALVTQPAMMLSPSSFDRGLTMLEGTSYWVRLPLEPAAAKTIALDADVVVEGTYTKLGDTDKIVGCEISGGSATISLPVDSFDERCFIGVKVSRIAFVRRSTHEVIKEWTQSETADGPLLWHQVRAGMNRYQLKAVEPSLSEGSYPPLKDQEGHTVNVETDPNHLVTAVQVNYSTSRSARDLLRELTATYGSPVASQCFGSRDYSSCEGEWNGPGGTVVNLSIMNEVTYRLSGSKRPTGVLLGK
ncbi:hypothetical protein FHS31_003033 [Sphingomonas vulcanisoli]|uniref:Uncharacterized protein n=1 Tax=Sphingomonas vulcanisoli TaxID=1658060 RepID=A0ABX0U0J2_9SPHN|nr:hypothetical protein [Sphingomonas vulcanisoli]NIJ09401.1 hypothetical protein [Sphingomonas vulcanisoli]